MLLAFLLIGVTLIVLGTVLGPLARQARPAPPRAQFDRAVYRDQITELEREVARGLVQSREAASAQLELQRRLLATDTATPAPAKPGKARPFLAAGLAALIVVVAGGLYLGLGAPRLPDEPYAERQPERDRAAAQTAQLEQIRAMVAKLADEMKSRPDDVDGWLRLGRSYAVLGQAEESAGAFAQAERLKPNDPQVLLAEAQALIAGHPVSEPISDQAVALLERVGAIVPDQPIVMWYLGLHAAQQGDFAEARTDWQKLLGVLPEDSDEHRVVQAALNAIKSK